jgi:conjugative transfer signal peptidase TraF
MKRLYALPIIVGVAAYVLPCLMMQCAGIRINASVSAPVGLYIHNSTGPYVGFCPADRGLSAERQYRHDTIPRWSDGCPDGAQQLLKPVVARAGDTVLLDNAGVVVNGKRLPHSAPLDHDTEGRPMTPWPLGTYAVPAGQIWVISSYSGRSYDSRYFGPVAVASVLERYRPLWVVE